MEKVTCAICGKEINKNEAYLDGSFWLCKDCDIEATLDRLPSSMMSMPFVVTKRICASTKGWQFLTSSYPNRHKDKRTFGSMDGIFMKGLLPGLKANEADMIMDGKPDPRQGIEVDVHICRVKQKGWHKVWVFGYSKMSRMVTPTKPKNVRQTEYGTRAIVSHGTMYVSTWVDRDYFPDMPDGAVFPVYMKVTRKQPKITV